MVRLYIALANWVRPIFKFTGSTSSSSSALLKIFSPNRIYIQPGVDFTVAFVNGSERNFSEIICL